MKKGVIMNGYRSGKRARPMSSRSIQELHYREEGKLSYAACFGLSAITLLYSLFIPLLLGRMQTRLEIWAWVMAITCIAFSWILVKKARWTVLTVLISLFFISFTGSALIPAIVLGTLVAACAYSSLVSACSKVNLSFPIVTPLVIYGISTVLTLDPVYSLFSLIFILPALVLGISCRLQASLNVSLLSCTAAIIIPLISLCATSIYTVYGEISFEALTKYAASVRELFESYTQYYLAFTTKTELPQALYREISEMVNSYVNLAPGIIVAVCLAFSFAVNSLKNDLLETQLGDSYISAKSKTISVSTVAALLFVVAHIISFTTDASNNTTFIAVVFGNVSFMLVPGLALVGITAVMNLNKKLGILSFIVFALLIFVLFNAASSFFILIALIGAFSVIVRSIDSWAKEFYGKGDNQ